MATATMRHGTGAAANRAATKLTGMGVFAGVVLLIVGGFNMINGFTALQHGSYYTHQMVYSNLTFWGWAFLIWGALEIVAGALTFAHSTGGMYLGVFLAGTAAILWFFMIFAAPWAALVGVTTSLLVIYGLVGSADSDQY
jgi:hypothetical protein